MTTITPITQAFASARGDNILPTTTPSDDIANQPDGFPVNQMLPDTNPSWKAVKEEEMNGVLNFYTNKLFQAGQGLQYTFDATVSATIGGYSAGAVLWCVSNNTYQVSLVANNTANFVTTPSYINDGINWKTLGGSIYITYNLGGVVITGFKIFNGINWDVTLSGKAIVNFTSNTSTGIGVSLSALGLNNIVYEVFGPASGIEDVIPISAASVQGSPGANAFDIFAKTPNVSTGSVDIAFALSFQSTL